MKNEIEQLYYIWDTDIDNLTSRNTLPSHGIMRCQQDITDDELEVWENELLSEEWLLLDDTDDEILAIVCTHEWVGSGFPGGQTWCKLCDEDYDDEKHG